ncbi:hypothetical protein [Shewanella sp. Isolate11]|uniref:hypothetical protein n=1 Tax=Shewanella sp. Isolate11 TaxID=2908530 RepID=UPI001EFD3CD8|nr:hypothetical protein [Shewanella sp. Isolate11]MCG9697317.1 hypothetical protein [Shewanella sp. Isolate11]
MNCKQATWANIIIAVFFAIAMMASSYFIADAEVSKNVLWMLLVAWLIPFFYINKKMRK